MKTKIYSVTVVCSQGVNRYAIGKKYNGLMLDKIEELALEYPDSIDREYVGYTEDKQSVFKVVNAPVDIGFVKE